MIQFETMDTYLSYGTVCQCMNVYEAGIVKAN